jgi:alcohol dehydrogenase class IV
MVKPFDLGRLPKILFGPGRISSLPGLLGEKGKNVLLVTGSGGTGTGGHLSNIPSLFENSDMVIYTERVASEPSPSIIDFIADANRGRRIDAVAAIGGGSVMDSGKAISAMLTTDGNVVDYLEGVGTKTHPGSKVYFVAVPTTSGTGSEATANAVISETGVNGFKRSLRHGNFMPDAAVVDPCMTTACPPWITAASGMDAFTQLLESYLSPVSGNFTDALALDGIRMIHRHIFNAYRNGGDIYSRSGMSYAALLSGITLTYAGLGLVHGFASTIGAMYTIPHGIICANLMGPVNRKNVGCLLKNRDNDEALTKYSEVGKILSGRPDKSDEWNALYVPDYIEELSVRLSLKKLGPLGLNTSAFDAIAKASGHKNNPVKVTDEDKIDILRKCL